MSKTNDLDKGLTNYGDPDFASYLRRSFAKSMGYSDEMLRRPIIGIATSASGFNNCHRLMPELVESVKRGVLAAGGLPLEFPTISLGEVFLHPTSMMFRNLMSMDVEEMIRAQPMSAVVLVGGCDKTVPAQLMGAISAGLPAIQLVAGPMLTGRYQGERLGACTDCRKYWARFRSGETSKAEIGEIENNLAATAGTCAVMGTASTMACIAEALGMSLPGSAAIPAVYADRLRHGEATGMRAVWLAESRVAPNDIINCESIENALRVLIAIGGSTNGVIHLAAIAGRLGLDFDLRQLNRISESTPVLVNLKPVGEHYMEDFHAAGGVPAVLQELKPVLHLNCKTVTGETLGEQLGRTRRFVNRDVIHSIADPVWTSGGLLALFGNIAPNGSLIKCAAADRRLFEHTGTAVVFKDLTDLRRRIDDPQLEVNSDSVLVLQNAGPVGAGMPEAGCLPIPAKLARAGVKDMVRISDARMSGTAFGTIILHASPESAIGGAVGLVETGDKICLSVKARRIDVLLSHQDLEKRRRGIQPWPVPARGYAKLYAHSVLGPELGCDFDFLRLRPDINNHPRSPE
ncbi:MAG TPA: dihydroxy-acid dehydratase [Terriglobales bacterium]|jgi:dihydroxy-acid dehydratase|nr:dihydroxy-acid dehydratase [Terriglobales bacterium]